MSKPEFQRNLKIIRSCLMSLAWFARLLIEMIFMIPLSVLVKLGQGSELWDNVRDNVLIPWTRTWMDRVLREQRETQERIDELEREQDRIKEKLEKLKSKK